MFRRKAKFFGFADSDGNVFGIRDESSQKMIFRFAVLTGLRTILISLCVYLVVAISPLGGIVFKRYLMKNPQVMLNSLQEMDRKERDKSQSEARESATSLAQSLAADSTLPFIGNKNGSNVIIEFYDYACSYCKKAAKEIESLLAKRSDVKVILQDYPVLSMNSLLAAKASLYVAKHHPDLLSKFHFKVFGIESITEDTIKKAGEQLGISGAELVKVMRDNTFEPEIKANYNRGSAIRATGTPVFIINGQLFVGYISVDQMLAALSK